MPSTFRHGPVTTTMDDGFHRFVERAKRTLRPVSSEVVGHVVDRVGESARERWPVKSGRSRSSLTWTVQAFEGQVVANIQNPAAKAGEAYALDIHFRGGGGNVWQSLVVEPLHTSIADLVPDLERELARAWGA